MFELEPFLSGVSFKSHYILFLKDILYILLMALVAFQS